MLSQKFCGDVVNLVTGDFGDVCEKGARKKEMRSDGELWGEEAGGNGEGRWKGLWRWVREV